LGFEFIETPNQNNVINYLVSVGIFLLSCLISGILLEILPAEKIFLFFSLIWFVTGMFFGIYLMSIYREFYPYQDFQVTIFKVIMLLIPPSSVSLLKSASILSSGCSPRKILPKVIVLSSIFLSLFFLFETAWWGYMFLFLVLLLIGAATILPILLLFDQSWTANIKHDPRLRNSFRLNSRILHPMFFLLVATSILIFDTLFSSNLQEWATNGLMLAMGMLATGVLGILFAKIDRGDFFLHVILPAIILVIFSLLVTWLLEAYTSYFYCYFIAGAGIGFLLDGLFRGMLFSLKKRFHLHAGITLLFTFFIVGLMAVLRPVLGELSLNTDEIDAIIGPVKLSWLIISMTCVAVLIITNVKKREFYKDYPAKLLGHVEKTFLTPAETRDWGSLDSRPSIKEGA